MLHWKSLAFDRELNAAGVPLRRWIIRVTPHAPLGVAVCIPSDMVCSQEVCVSGTGCVMRADAPHDAHVAMWDEVLRWAKRAWARTVHTMASCRRHGNIAATSARAQHIGTRANLSTPNANQADCCCHQ
jgi:hypothetical protein